MYMCIVHVHVLCIWFLRELCVLQVSYGSSTPTLSNRQMFPSFFRTIPSEVQGNYARFALMDRFDWRRVATLHETRNIFSLVHVMYIVYIHVHVCTGVHVHVYIHLHMTVHVMDIAYMYMYMYVALLPTDSECLQRWLSKEVW